MRSSRANRVSRALIGNLAHVVKHVREVRASPKHPAKLLTTGVLCGKFAAIAPTIVPGIVRSGGGPASTPAGAQTTVEGWATTESASDDDFVVYATGHPTGAVAVTEIRVLCPGIS